MSSGNQHHFFLYDATLKTSELLTGAILTLNAELSTRIATVLRLRTGETCTLFANNGTMATIQLTSILAGKGAKVQGTITKLSQAEPLAPQITLICGITKHATFEEICYTATQLGVTQIFPVTTQKSYTKAYSAKDMQRCFLRTIAAAEQSKQIFLPTLHAPSTLQAVLKHDFIAGSTNILFETDGQPLRKLLQEKVTHLAVAFGPEGGFTSQECELLTAAHFNKLQLCKPILRTEDAVEVGIGIIRCLF